MAYTSPGVYVAETAFKSRPVVRTAGATPAAFLGTSLRGNSSKAIAISSWNQYKLEFGDLDPTYDLGYAVYQYFANGGRDAYVIRVFGSSSTAASATIPYTKTPATGASSAGNLYTVNARSVGDWANTANTVTGGLTLVTTAGTITNSLTGTAVNVGTFNLSVRLNSVEVEYWPDLSPNPASSRYAPTVINNYSTYITLSNAVDITPFLGSMTYGTYGSNISFVGGSISAPSTTDWTTAGLNKLDIIPEGVLINAVGQYDNTIISAVMAKASTRGTSFAIIDPDPSKVAIQDMITATSSYSPKNYGAVYYPMLVMTDPSKTGIGAIRNTFPGGAVAGAYVRSELERTVAKPPAGYSMDVRNAFTLVTPISDGGAGTTSTGGDIGTLYTAGVNTFKAVPGVGICIMGARTLETTRPDKYVNLRRSLNYVKERSFFLTQFAVFEPNDQALWATVRVRLTKFLTDFWQIGGLKGASPAEAFYIICDSSNNTASAIENGELRIEIGVALQYPAEFVIITISQIAGSSASI